MRRTTHVITTGVLVAALGLAPRLASAQTGSSSSGSGTTSGSTAGSQATPSDQTGSQSSTTSPSSGTSTQPSTGTTQSASSTTSSQASGGVDPAAARQHLANARQALADLTKLPAATTLQGDQRTAITNFIQAFNAFATAQNDWKSKFEVVDQQLDQILATAGAGGPSADASTGTTGSTSTSPSTSASGTSSTAGSASTGASASAGATGTGGASASAAGGGYDPAIVDKLKTMRTELDAFLLATGDPEPHIKAIEKILNGGNAAGSSSVGTSGSTGASSGGSVTLTPDQVSEIRSHLESMRQAAGK